MRERTPGRALIVSGGSVDKALALRLFSGEIFPGVRPGRGVRERLLYIAADRGLKFFAQHGLKPDVIVGDFDSGSPELAQRYAGDPQVEIRRFRPEKDFTDTELALDAAMERGCTEVVLLGATGTRLDHVFANLQLLAQAAERGVLVRILDPHNAVTLRRGPFIMKKEEQWGKYISFFAFGGPVTGLTLKGFKYEVTDITLEMKGSLGVSNELEAPEGEVSFTSGLLLVMETRD